jgi:iron complex outermembrane recepter protein
VNVYAAYTFADYRFDEFIDGESDFSGNKLTGASPHLLNAGIDLNPGSKGLYGNLNFQFVDAMPVRDDNAVFSSAYRLLNLRLGYRFSIGKRWNLDAYGGINNIWNEKYASMIQINAAGFGAAPRYYYPGLPRHFFAGFSVNLSL